MSAAVSCLACSAGNARYLGSKHTCLVYECRTCRAVFALGDAHAAGLSDMYDHYYDRADFVLSATVRASLERLVRSAAPFRKTGRWLDVGYGEGGLLSVVEGFGWQCHGIEIAPQVLEYGGRRGWIVSPCPETDPRFRRGEFDVITMIEFLEHIATPTDVLTVAADLLRPGGLLYLTTPNARSLNRRALGLRWSTISPPEHQVLWTARALRRALGLAGFRVRRIRTQGFNPAEMIARVKALRSGIAPQVDRNASAVALSEAMARSAIRRALKRTANEALNLLRAGDTLKIWAVRS